MENPKYRIDKTTTLKRTNIIPQLQNCVEYRNTNVQKKQKETHEPNETCRKENTQTDKKEETKNIIFSSFRLTKPVKQNGS